MRRHRQVIDHFTRQPEVKVVSKNLLVEPPSYRIAQANPVQTITVSQIIFRCKEIAILTLMVIAARFCIAG